MLSRKRWLIVIFLCANILSLAACSSTASTTPQTDTVKDQASFIDALKTKGVRVDIAGTLDQPFLQAEGTNLRLSGGDLKQPTELQSFNYDDKDLGKDGSKAAAEDASQIDSSGNPRTMRIQWIASPHFFRKERVIVIYLGSDPNAIALLTELLGPQFAGK